MLLLLILVWISVVVGCHPECRRTSDPDTVAFARCSSYCAASQCEVHCEPSSEVVSCQPISCRPRCPVVDACESDSCPPCETVCDPPICTGTCQILCEAPQCGWKCFPAIPNLDYVCEHPACTFTGVAFSSLASGSNSALLTLLVLLVLLGL